MAATTWNRLPMEMKMAIVDVVPSPLDVKSLSMVDRSTYNAALHSLYKTVHLTDFQAIQRFVDSVPLASYGRYVRELDLTTSFDADSVLSSSDEDERINIGAVTNAVSMLLAACPHIHTLSLRMHGSLDVSVLPHFTKLGQLRHLTLANCADEETCPLSERFVVWIAASIPNLTRLMLERVSRSTMHSPELVGVYPYVPLVSGDDDVPDHVYLGSDLRLPSLIRLPSLRQLAIRDTHLGDPNWCTISTSCLSSQLQTLEIGTCHYESEESNTLWTERLLKAAGGPSLEELELGTGVTLSSDYFQYDHQNQDLPPTPAFPLLRKLRLALSFPADLVVDTLSNLAGSPIEQLEVHCYEEELEDMCDALNEFLALRVELMTSSDEDVEEWFSHKLRRIDVYVVPNTTLEIISTDEVDSIYSGSPMFTTLRGTDSAPEAEDWVTGVVFGFQEFCQDLEIESTFKSGVAVRCVRATECSSSFPSNWTSTISALDSSERASS